jgi:REP element-mobilizing transposase RayT
VREGVPSLRTANVVREIERTFAAVCDRTDFRLIHYSLQGNHAHLIVEADGPGALGCGMKAIAARLARAVNRVFERSGPVLADRYHVRVLRTPREVRNALAYVLLNARRHAAKAGRMLSRAIGIDPASSGRWFDGWRTSPLVVFAARLPGVIPVSAPRSWLLVEGWRRRGLLDPDEIPGADAR